MKTILVTGATGEIGRAICQQLAEQKVNLILTARTEESLKTLSLELKSKGIQCDWCISDFCDTKSFSKLINLMESGIDGLVVMPPQPLESNDILPSDEFWEKLFKNSFIGPANLVKCAIPSLSKKNYSSVVLISGITSIQPLSHYASSSVLRTMWLGFFKTLSDKYGANNISFNTLSIGGVITGKFSDKLKTEAKLNNISPSELLNKKVSNVPLKRYAEISEIGSAVSFLLTSEARKHLTGQNIAFDGGFTRRY